MAKRFGGLLFFCLFFGSFTTLEILDGEKVLKNQNSSPKNVLAAFKDPSRETDEVTPFHSYGIEIENIGIFDPVFSKQSCKVRHSNRYPRKNNPLASSSARGPPLNIS